MGIIPTVAMFRRTTPVALLVVAVEMALVF